MRKSVDAVNDVFVEGMKALTNFVSVLRNCIDKKRAHLSTLSLIIYAIVAVNEFVLRAHL